VQPTSNFIILGRQAFIIYYQNYFLCTARFFEMTMGKRFKQGMKKFPFVKGVIFLSGDTAFTMWHVC